MTLRVVTLIPCLAVAASLPRPGNPVDVPMLGLKLPLPTDAQSTPLPPAEIRTYIHTQGNRTWTEELYEANELWYASQHVAEWTLPSRGGTRLILGRATVAAPSGLGAAHIRREQFTAYTNSPLASMDDPDGASLGAWLAAFADGSLHEPQSLAPPRTTRLRALIRYTTETPEVTAWLLRFDRNGGYNHLPDGWFALVAVAPNADSAAREREFVEGAIIANLTPMGRFDGHESAAERLRRGQSRSTGFRAHPSRDAAHASVAAHTDLQAIDSEDFVLIHKGGKEGSASQRLARDLLDDLQKARAVYARMFPGFAETSDNVSVIYLPASEEEYVAHVGEEHRWSGGLYNGGTRELCIRPITGGRASAAYAHTLATAFHEGFHQYLHQATGIAQPAVWYNEGHACFFERLSFANGRTAVDEDPDRLRTLEAFLRTRQPLPLQALVSMDYASFYAGTDDDRRLKYALAWGLCYFLQRGAPLVRNKPYADVLPTYLEALQETGNGAEATRRAFGDINFDTLERDMRTFWTTPRSRSLAKREPLAR